MPGSVQTFTPSTVLPWAGAISYSETREYPVRTSDAYKDGRTQRAVFGSATRRLYQLERLVPEDEAADMVQFFNDQKGSQIPFWFYSTEAEFDASGTSNTGRVAVRFASPIEHTQLLGRHRVAFSLIETS